MEQIEHSAEPSQELEPASGTLNLLDHLRVCSKLLGGLSDSYLALYELNIAYYARGQLEYTPNGRGAQTRAQSVISQV